MKSTSRTIESVKKEIFNIVGEEYSLNSTEYKNNSIKLDFKHNTCGNEFKMPLRNFLIGQRCPRCAMEKRIKSATRNRKTVDEIKKEVLNLTLGEYNVTLNSEYRNNKEKIHFKHETCGFEFDMKLNNFLNGQRCPKCSEIEDKKRLLKIYRKGIDAIKKKYTKKQEDFQLEISALTNNAYEVKSEYQGCHKSIEMLHKECGNIFKITPNRFLNGQRCPFCAESTYEQKISEYLKIRNINFEFQKTYDDCVYINKLRFDFFISGILLEYDGEFHYKDIFKDGSLKETQIRDKLKNKYCRENKIPLLRIPFWEKNRLDEILNSLLNLLQNGKLSYTKFEKWRRSLKIKSYKQYKTEKKKE